MIWRCFTIKNSVCQNNENIKIIIIKCYFYNLGEEKVMCAKMIEELKSKHEIEIERLNALTKQNAADYASQELIKINADYQQKFDKAKEILTLKNNTVRILHDIHLFCICC